MKYVAAIDQGTTGTRFMVFDRCGRVIAAAYAEHKQIYPQPGWVEHDAMEVWTNTCRVTEAAMAKVNVQPKEIAGIGITNQRETTLVWDRHTGRPLHNAIVWQCTRTLPLCQRLIDDGLEETFRAKAGLPVATYFSGPKIKWLLDNVPGLLQKAEAGDALFGNMDTWLIWNLTGGVDGGAHVTDPTNASRTMLMNLQTLDWDDELLRMLEIPRPMLPTIRPSSDGNAYGYTRLAGTPGGHRSADGSRRGRRSVGLGALWNDHPSLRGVGAAGGFRGDHPGSSVGFCLDAGQHARCTRGRCHPGNGVGLRHRGGGCPLDGRVANTLADPGRWPGGIGPLGLSDPIRVGRCIRADGSAKRLHSGRYRVRHRAGANCRVCHPPAGERFIISAATHSFGMCGRRERPDGRSVRV